MPVEEIPQTLWILLGVQTGLLVLIWLGQLIQGARLRRIERSLLSRNAPVPELQRVKSEARQGQRLFDRWLDEDPSRHELPKKEQFAGFRKWRAEQGMNWDPERSGD
ncbi:hypothetical protein [Haloferula sp. A504]|uniref:hypothetical protein n=1 Tax=Haloferula sp. A504 TaxID=3373601 RepID=UPI0031C5070F|nr:hypothetical protein [Verrucomicrobiaceae bacterium E54]